VSVVVAIFTYQAGPIDRRAFVLGTVARQALIILPAEASVHLAPSFPAGTVPSGFRRKAMVSLA